MPKLWTETIESHRREVRDAVLDAAAELLHQHGAVGLTMAQVATAAGIGRATLYKYFPDIEAILLAWHDRQVAAHLEAMQLAAAGTADPLSRLRAMLDEHAAMVQKHHGLGVLHGALSDKAVSAVGQAHHGLQEIITEAITAAAEAGAVRSDISAAELAMYCLHALNAASGTKSRAALRRLVSITTDALTTAA